MKIIKISEVSEVRLTLNKLARLFESHDYMVQHGMGMTESFIRTVFEIKRIPNVKLNNDRVVAYLKSFYFEAMKHVPEFYNDIYPEIIKKDAGIIKITKKSIVDYYKRFVNQSPELNNKILKMFEEFKDEDFIISILYKELYNKIEENK
jgi:hypothetical protein